MRWIDAVFTGIFLMFVAAGMFFIIDGILLLSTPRANIFMRVLEVMSGVFLVAYFTHYASEAIYEFLHNKPQSVNGSTSLTAGGSFPKNRSAWFD